MKLNKTLAFVEEYEQSLYYQKFLNEIKENDVLIETALSS